MKEKTKKQAGFTLIEIVLVIAIASTVFLAIYAFFVNTIRHDTENRYEIIASNLAQEGVEIVRNIRDENILQAINDPPANMTEINDGIDAPDCYPHVDSFGETSCGSGSFLLIDSDNQYQNESGDDTIFERECIISNVLQPPGGHVESFDVECTVEWESFVGAGEDGKRKISAKSTLTNWQE